MSDVLEGAKRAKAAALAMQSATLDQRNGALEAMASALRNHTAAILSANEKDVAAGKAAGLSDGLIDRLALDDQRVNAMADALLELRDLPDPLGIVQEQKTLENGLDIKRVSVPLGVVAMVYEARPNVTADAVGICVKTGNAVILRGGSSAFESNRILSQILSDAAVEAGLPEGFVYCVSDKSRKVTDELLRMRGIVDVLIPRGGAGLINHCVEYATVPVIETGTGNCHAYVAATANTAIARDIIMNGKTQRVGVCNALESVLVDRAIADTFLPVVLKDLSDAGVIIHGDCAVERAGDQTGIPVVCATQEDWATEYLALEVSIAVVDGVRQAIDHINRYGTKHSEVIITEDYAQAELFLTQVDAAAVYVNASTRFTDGGMFGLGAEIGISTQKLHARGPFALEALSTYKYLIHGTGQVRA